MNMLTGQNKFDVVIIGGGPAGSSTAALLAAAGISVCVLEQKAFPRQKVCGEFLSSAAWSVFAELGIEQALIAIAGPPLKRLVAYSQYGPPLWGILPPGHSGRFARAVSRDLMDQLLLRRAAELGAQIIQPAHVLEVRGNASDGFKVHGSGTPHPLHARTVVLAHGLPQRGAMDHPSVPVSHSQSFLCFKAHLENVQLEDDTTAIGGVEGLYVGLLRTSDFGLTVDHPGPPAVHKPRYNLAFVVNRKLFAGHGSGEALYRHLLANNQGFARRLRHARPLGAWLACGPMQPGVRNIYQDGRFFVGNAAGEVHALIGEGMTLALSSGRLLAHTLIAHRRELAPGGDLTLIGEAYRRGWVSEFTGRLQAGNLFSRLLMRPVLSALATEFLDTFPEALAACIRFSGKTAEPTPIAATNS